ncbi:clasp N terminal-domain-containing protein [Fimicolochytrium jonesii]|uniref:clasp N terminal-domain-containing protein n=1 Tax=Fimicolochytrium jonesii TaxID=1396493 RepID=UPI0022FE039C|nr:clasp N terminal-domain-containing protein [Fimicolochytrium jonesii]KAI8826042.1 clasp N terminal-domain-containing protein [Fimicolochytrium jonesii]
MHASSPPALPSGGSTAPTPTPTNVNSLKEAEAEINSCVAIFEGKETEENWQARDAAIQKLRSVCRGNAKGFPGFVQCFRPAAEALARTVHSLRTALVLTTCTGIQDLCSELGRDVDPLADLLLSNLLKITNQAKKVVATAAINAIQVVLASASYQPKFTQYFLTALGDKNGAVRAAGATFVKTTLEVMSSTPENKSTLERTGGLENLEKALKKGLQDATGPVRQTCREAFAVYRGAWLNRSEVLYQTLDAATRKAIDRAQTASAPSSARPSIKRVVTARSGLVKQRSSVISVTDIPVEIVVPTRKSKTPREIVDAMEITSASNVRKWNDMMNVAETEDREQQDVNSVPEGGDSDIHVADLSRIDMVEHKTLLDMTNMTFEGSLLDIRDEPDIMDETMPSGFVDNDGHSSFSVISSDKASGSVNGKESNSSQSQERSRDVEQPANQSTPRAKGPEYKAAAPSPTYPPQARQPLSEKGQKELHVSTDALGKRKSPPVSPSPNKPGNSMGTPGDRFAANQNLLTTGGTPLSEQKTKSARVLEMPNILHSIQEGRATISDWRRLYRIVDNSDVPESGRQGPTFDESTFWNDSFDKTLGALLGALQRRDCDDFAMETCLLVLGRLIQKHDNLGADTQSRILNALLRSMCSESKEICASANSALEMLLSQMKPEDVYRVLLALLDAQRSGTGGSEPGLSKLALDIITRLLPGLDGLIPQHELYSRVGSIAFEYVNSSSSCLRRAATYCMVELYLVAGEKMWQHVGALSGPQKKLVTVACRREMGRRQRLASTNLNDTQSPRSWNQKTVEKSCDSGSTPRKRREYNQQNYALDTNWQVGQ